MGKPARALDTLQEVFRNKKWTYTWSESVIEPIMFKYLELCVELKKSHIAKEGLFQYRNMFQLVNVGSLENVIRGYLKMAEERTEAAQQKSSQAVLDIDDLDNFATPESILMSAVCGEDAQDRSDRTILLPWVKFLWESYCQCLELLRVNTHCEMLYHDIARMAFQFCLKYNRKMEFRKLSEKLRKHLEDICKVTTQTTGVSISKPETQQFNLDTRLYQLDSAIQMELWQEAYKAIEDINNLMTISKKTPVAKTMANYYQKMAMVFWKAGNQLFHASALLKLFQLTREMKKNITPEELQRMASHVLVATLAIPLPSAHPEFDRFIETDKSPLEKAQRLANLLGIQQPPTRISLIKELNRLNVVKMAGEQFQNLYNWMEVEFNPLSLCNRVKSVTDVITADEANILRQYVQSIHDVTLVRLIRQISQVYQTIRFSRILALAEFTDNFSLERILVDCVRHNDMQIRIDHQERCIHFGSDLAESQREDRTDGPHLQAMPSEQIRSQLVNMSVVLHRAIAAINPNHKKADREKLRTQLVKSYEDNKDKEHQRILQRQKIIEDRKEFIEKLNIEREVEEQRRLDETTRQQKLAEQKRLDAETEERERKRLESEIQLIKEKNLKDKMAQISQTEHGKKILKKLDETAIKELDAEQIAAKEAEELIRERKELQSKLKQQEKKTDYFERAKRIEEIPLIEKYLENKSVEDKKFWEEQEKSRIENSKAERLNAVAQQERLKRMHPDRDVFLSNLRTERNSMYLDKVKEFNIRLEDERKKRMIQRVQERREERRRAWIHEREEEERRKQEELRKIQEEEERLEREKRAKEREIENEKLRVQAEKQRIKEEEAERKLQEEREKLHRDQPPKERDVWRAGGADRDSRPAPRDNPESGWRRQGGESADAPKSSDVWRAKAPVGDSAGIRRGGEDGGIRRGGDDGGLRRGGDDGGLRRGGDDGGLRRGGDDGGLRRRVDEGGIRRAGDDGGIRRAGDDGGIRRAGEDGGIRRAGEDGGIRRSGEDGGIRRAGEDGGFRRGGDDGGFRRGGDDNRRGGGRDDFQRGGDRPGFGRRDGAPGGDRGGPGIFRRNDDRGEIRRGGDDRGEMRRGGDRSAASGTSRPEGAGAWRRAGDSDKP